MSEPRPRSCSLKDFAADRCIHHETARLMAADGTIPTIRIGRAVRVDLDALEAMEAATPAPLAAPAVPDPDWVAEQVAKFTPDDLRRAAEVLLSVAGSLDNRAAVA